MGRSSCFSLPATTGSFAGAALLAAKAGLMGSEEWGARRASPKAWPLASAIVACGLRSSGGAVQPRLLASNQRSRSSGNWTTSLLAEQRWSDSTRRSAPMFQTSHAGESRRRVEGRRARRHESTFTHSPCLLIIQGALSVVLLVGAGLFVQLPQRP